ncbi:MAG: hypothetical protein AB7O97_20200 [Planctomycetota bacterium]
MNHDSTQTVPPPVRHPMEPSGTGGPGPGAPGDSDALRAARGAAERGRDLRTEMERLLGGIELEDLRNGGGQ